MYRITPIITTSYQGIKIIPFITNITNIRIIYRVTIPSLALLVQDPACGRKSISLSESLRQEAKDVVEKERDIMRINNILLIF
jgi:hypothetical protein